MLARTSIIAGTVIGTASCIAIASWWKGRSERKALRSLREMSRSKTKGKARATKAEKREKRKEAKDLKEMLKDLTTERNGETAVTPGGAL